MHVLVTGGTGRLGRIVVPLLSAAGHSVRILSRVQRTGPGLHVSCAVGDLITGAGLSEAVAGIDAIVHLASDPGNALVVDVEGSRRLVHAAAVSGVSHLIVVSIVGVDRIPYPYYRRKFQAEQVITDGPVPFSILRATQFHSFVATLFNTAARFPLIMPIPSGFFVQSVAIEEVAARLCRAVANGPNRRVQDFGGPEVLTIEDAAAVWTRLMPRGFKAWPVPIYIPGKIAAAFRSGYNTCPDGERGTETWREWLTRSKDQAGGDYSRNMR
jgi:uncharacterized protein YbjT (DUF2867 family)